MLSLPITSGHSIGTMKGSKTVTYQAQRSSRPVAVRCGQSVEDNRSRKSRQSRPTQGEIQFFAGLAVLRLILPIVSEVGPDTLLGGVANYLLGDPVTRERAWKVAVAKYSRDSMVTAPALHDSGSTVSPAAVDLNE